MGKVLIIDDEKQILSLLSRIIGLEGYEVFQATNCKVGIKQLEQNDPEVVLCDVCLPDGSGVELVSELKRLRPLSEVILLTAHGNIPDGVQAIKNGAFDYITKGDDNNKILPLIAKAMEKATVAYSQQKAVGKQYSFATVIGRSPAIEEAVSLARKVAATDVPVLLTGETGTGKEVFAQSIHQHSSRSDKAFVAINCSSFSRDLLESEMFGHKAGAFTGALKETKGLFEEASGGTIFLDEIGDLELSCQVKLLRVLQDQTFEVLGDSRPRKVDIRVVSATNRDLRSMVADRTFREDLFYRINLITVHLPALRERREDIPLLARYFADKQSEVNGLPRVEFSSDAQTYLSRLPFLGNIRELKNLVERTILVSGKAVLEASDFESQCFHTMLSAKAEAASSLEGLTLDELEKQTILQALKTHAGNLSHVATALGISRAALYRRLEKYDIPVDK